MFILYIALVKNIFRYNPNSKSATKIRWNNKLVLFFKGYYHIFWYIIFNTLFYWLKFVKKYKKITRVVKYKMRIIKIYYF